MTTQADRNISKFRRTAIAMNFVKRNDGCWDHQKWLDFCEMLKVKGYTPIDFDKVGALLEEKKTTYLQKKK